MRGKRLILGVISDTHGLLRPSALAALVGVDRIIHAGDVGSEAILAQLAALAPVTVVRGNIDSAPWAAQLPKTAALDTAAGSIHIRHDRHELDNANDAPCFRVLISGHSHQPSIEERKGVLYLNPGSAGPRRFRLPISVARLEVSSEGQLSARLIELTE